MDIFIKIGFDILAFSCIMVLIVSGLAIIASLMGIFNLGHGEFVLLGAYSVYFFRELGLPEWTGMLFAPFFVGTFRLNYRTFLFFDLIACTVWASGLVLLVILWEYIGSLF